MTIADTFFNRPVRLLAPMEGLTDPLMRKILTQIAHDVCKQCDTDINGDTHANNKTGIIGENSETSDNTFSRHYGYDWSVSEFIRVTQHVLPDHVFYTYIPELHNGSKTDAGTPIHAQLLGSDPQLMAQNALRVASLGSPAVDLNFGCPAKTVNKHKGGSVLLDDPTLLREIISAVRQAVPSHIPVSAKIRLGYENTDNIDDIRKAIGDSGADWLTIHARTKTQGYKPPAYWEKIVGFTELPIPIIANGEIWNHEHAQQCSRQSNTPHLMLGRGAVTRPDLVAQVDHGDIPQAQVPWQSLLRQQIDFLQGDYRSEKALIGRYKQWLAMLTKGYTEAEDIWSVLKREKDIEVVINRLQEQLL